MAYWSNIQASRVSRGANWKNLWIPNYKRLYIKFFLHDYMLSRYIKTKYFSDDKLNWTFMYYYDYSLQKTFDKTFLYLKKYNIDFSRMSQAAYIGKILMLHGAFAKIVNSDFYTLSVRTKPMINFYFQPLAYYFFYLNNYHNENFNELKLYTGSEFSLSEEELSLVQLFSSSLFLTKNVFSSKTNFFPSDNFDQIGEFSYFFAWWNVSNLNFERIPTKYIYKDKYRLSNFLFNPVILKKYPNFVLFYDNWLHKSWQFSKKKLLHSIKLFDVDYSHMDAINPGINYFFSKYVWFFFVMWELNTYATNSDELGVGISQEFLWKQIALLHLKIWIRENIFFTIKEVWFYLRAYLWYFSYEGKINLNRTKLIFKKLFSFKKLLQQTCAGYEISVPALLVFLKTFYTSAFKKRFLVMLLDFYLAQIDFLGSWYLYFSKSFYRAIKILRWFFQIWKISILLKMRILHFLTKNINFWYLPFFWKKLFPINPKIDFLSWEHNLKTFKINVNTMLIFFFFFFDLKVDDISEHHSILIFTTSPFLNSKKNYTVGPYLKDSAVDLSDKYIEYWRIIRYSDWIAIAGFNPELVFTFLRFSKIWRFIWKKKFIYFYYAISHTTPKIFFWLFTDLSNLTHFTMIVHLAIVYWQNFFFYYLSVLRTLKKLYAWSNPEILLYLSWGRKMFVQRSNFFITLLDLFSSSFRNFLPMGLSTMDTNFRIMNNWFTFSLADFAFRMASFGKPNNWLLTTGNKLAPINKFSYTENLTESPLYFPFLSIKFTDYVYFKKRKAFFFEKKKRLNVNFPTFTIKTPIHLIIEHFSNLELNATLIAVFVKKKLEKEHLLAEILKSLNLLVGQADTIKGFMFLLKGRFSRKERATKVWFKKGKLEQVTLWTKLDYCKLPITLKYGVASVRIWLLLNNVLNSIRAII